MGEREGKYREKKWFLRIVLGLNKIERIKVETFFDIMRL